MKQNTKIALVHDWLTGMRGGEKVLEAICELYPKADLFTLLYVPGSTSPIIEDRKIITSPLQKMPFIPSKYRYYLPLFPLFAEFLDVKDYDLVISTSHAVAKNVRKGPGALHVSYVFSPMRYAWDQFDHYFGSIGGGSKARFSSEARGSYFGGSGSYSLPVNLAARLVRPYLKWWDKKTASRTDEFVCISNFIAKRIRDYYGREAEVIYPPVDVKRFADAAKEETPGVGVPPQAKHRVLGELVVGDYHLVVSALVPYKRVDVVVEAFNELGLPLKIAGTGPEEKRLKLQAKDNIEFLGWVKDEDIPDLYAGAKGFIMPQTEDFGITAVEAQAAGCPVIAFRAGGALETVIEGKTGVFFSEQTPESLVSAVKKLEALRLRSGLKLEDLQRNALQFDRSRFKAEFERFVNERIRHHA